MTESLTIPKLQPISDAIQDLCTTPLSGSDLENIYHLGHFNLIIENYAEAEQAFTWLVDQDLNDWEVIHGLAISLLKQDKIGRAMTFLTILKEKYSDQCDVSELIFYLETEHSQAIEDYLYKLDEIANY
jgi:hypothetical protein